eukprot:4209846-Pleurochrysis_carterae.AAC.1
MSFTTAAMSRRGALRAERRGRSAARPLQPVKELHEERLAPLRRQRAVARARFARERGGAECRRRGDCEPRRPRRRASPPAARPA